MALIDDEKLLASGQGLGIEVLFVRSLVLFLKEPDAACGTPVFRYCVYPLYELEKVCFLRRIFWRT